jgi:hypothetical protein
LWGTVLIVVVLFGVSAFTKKSAQAQLAGTTVSWGEKWDRFEGWKDWRLQWLVLAIVTLIAYWRLW